METDPRDNRPIEEKRQEVSREDLEIIAKAKVHEEAINSPLGQIFISETLVELERAINEILNVNVNQPGLTRSYFIGLIMKCQANLAILKKFGFVMNYGKELAKRQVQRAVKL